MVASFVIFSTSHEQVSHDAKLPFEWAHTLLFVAALVRCGAIALGLVNVAEAVFSEAHAMDNANIPTLQVIEKLRDCVILYIKFRFFLCMC